MRLPVPRPRSLLVGIAAVVVAGSLLAAEGERWQLPGLGGGELTEARLAQGATLLVVWASWSPRCRDIVPQTNALVERWGERGQVVTVVFQEEPQTVEGFLRGQTLRAPVYLDRDGAFSKKHAVTTLPSLVIFRDGEAVYQGKLPAEPDSLIRRYLG